MVKIGLEIHAYLNTKEKLFCHCATEHNLKYHKPNTNICPVCTAQPGSKPLMPNKEAIRKIIQISLILGCKINNEISFQRKHYSWPDLPKGFQSTISGPHAIENAVNGKFLGIGITECHLEEDPAAWNPTSGKIDYNRSGSPLIEIVTEPDFTNAKEVTNWLKNLKLILIYIKAIDKGSGLKADVNVSIPGGKRIEIKNINSIKNIEKAIEVEINRQKKNLPKIQETRRFDEIKGKTILMRTKENANDYRFILEPDLPKIIIKKEEIQKIKNELPETPQDKLKKIIKKYKIDEYHAKILTKNIELVSLFEEIVKKIPVKTAISFLTIELLGILNQNKKTFEEVEIDPKHIVELLEAFQKKQITENKAKDILKEFIPKSFSPKQKISRNLKIDDKSQIKEIVEKIIKENKKAVKDYKSGNKSAINFLIGQVMKETNKRANYASTKELLELIIKE